MKSSGIHKNRCKHRIMKSAIESSNYQVLERSAAKAVACKYIFGFSLVGTHPTQDGYFFFSFCDGRLEGGPGGGCGWVVGQSKVCGRDAEGHSRNQQVKGWVRPKGYWTSHAPAPQLRPRLRRSVEVQYLHADRLRTKMTSRFGAPRLLPPIGGC